MFVILHPPVPFPMASKDLSIDFLVSSDGFQKDCFSSFVLYKLKNDPEVISCAAGPRPFQFPFKLMRSQ